MDFSINLVFYLLFLFCGSIVFQHFLEWKALFYVNIYENQCIISLWGVEAVGILRGVVLPEFTHQIRQNPFELEPSNGSQNFSEFLGPLSIDQQITKQTTRNGWRWWHLLTPSAFVTLRFPPSLVWTPFWYKLIKSIMLEIIIPTFCFYWNFENLKKSKKILTYQINFHIYGKYFPSSNDRYQF